MLDLAFLILYIYIIINAMRGKVNDKVCFAALIVGLVAVIAGINSPYIDQILNMVVLLIVCTLKKVAHYLADNYKSKRAKLEEEYREKLALRAEQEQVLPNVNYDDPNVRFGGGSGENWK